MKKIALTLVTLFALSSLVAFADDAQNTGSSESKTETKMSKDDSGAKTTTKTRKHKKQKKGGKETEMKKENKMESAPSDTSGTAPGTDTSATH